MFNACWWNNDFATWIFLFFAFQVKLSESDPFNDEERERLEVEKMARKFEATYVSISFRNTHLCFWAFNYQRTDL